MKNKGFTLIELLAVIVILAIIALIATPIIIGIINDIKEESNERSVELYANAVKNSIALYQLTNSNTPKTFSDLTVEYKGDVECAIKELYSDGSFYLEGCRVNKSENEYSYGTKQGNDSNDEITEQIIKGNFNSVCKLADDSEVIGINMGAKYNCKVDPNKEPYTFYILSVEEDSINLIMDSNIRTGGEAVKEENPTTEQKGLVAWVSKSDYISEEVGGTVSGYGDNGSNSKGPITAMQYIQEATKDWINVNIQIIKTFTKCNDNSNYTEFEMGKIFESNARLPYYSEVTETGCVVREDLSCPLWMIDYLNNGSYNYENRTSVTGVNGYWLLSASKSYFGEAWTLLHSGYQTTNTVKRNNYNGVRPVINLSI